MKVAFFALSAAALLPTLSLQAQTKSPFVETTTLTFFWSMSRTVVGSTQTGVPDLPDVSIYDPESLPVGYETYTYVTGPQPYLGTTTGNSFRAGANRQLIHLLMQRFVRQGLISRTQMGSTNWQFIAVRETPSNVRELATNPYRIFLSNGGRFSPEIPAYGQEPVVDDPVPGGYSTEDGFNDSTPEHSVITLDTGITITLGQYNGNYTESKWAENNWVRSASGNVATAFRVDFGALFYDDPLYNQNRPETAPYNYNLKRNYWQASASGYINYGIRSIAGPLPTFLASNSSVATATGWFRHQHSEYRWNDDFDYYEGISGTFWGASGIAPLKVTLAPIQYQKRTLFALDIPAAPLAGEADNVNVTGTFGGLSSGVQVSWGFTNNETGFILERKDSEESEWIEVIRPDMNEGSIVDPDAPVDTLVSYRVAAFNGEGVSEYSQEILVSTVAMPTNLTGDAPSPTEITLTWDDNSEIETGYEVQRFVPAANGNPARWDTIATLGADIETYTDTELKAKTAYTYRVRAFDELDPSAWSNVVTVTTDDENQG